MVAVSEKILGQKIDVKNSKTENGCEKLRSVKILGRKMCEKFWSENEKKKRTRPMDEKSWESMKTF